MQRQGYKIIPVNPQIAEALGEKAYPSLPDVPEKIDLVDVFRRAEFVDEIVEQAIQLKIPAIWLQEDVINERAAERARKAGDVRCDGFVHSEGAPGEIWVAVIRILFRPRAYQYYRRIVPQARSIRKFPNVCNQALRRNSGDCMWASSRSAPYSSPDSTPLR